MIRDSPALSAWSGQDKVALGLLDEAVCTLHRFRRTWRENWGTKYTLDRSVDAYGMGPGSMMRGHNAWLSKAQVDVCVYLQYFEARAMGATEMTAARLSTLKNDLWQENIVALSAPWGIATRHYLQSRSQRILEAFTCNGGMTPQADWYMESRTQLLQPNDDLSGAGYWRDIWKIPDVVWSQLQAEYEIINHGREWTQPEFRAYATLTFSKPDNGGRRCRSRYYTYLHPTEDEPPLSSDSEDAGADDDEEDPESAEGSGAATRANDSDSPRPVCLPRHIVTAKPPHPPAPPPRGAGGRQPQHRGTREHRGGLTYPHKPSRSRSATARRRPGSLYAP